METLRIAQPYKPDMKAMFQGHIDLGGGISGSSGVGNLASTFKTNYQINYNDIYALQKKDEQTQGKRNRDHNENAAR